VFKNFKNVGFQVSFKFNAAIVLGLTLTLSSAFALSKQDKIKSDCYGVLSSRVAEKVDHDLHFKLLASQRALDSILADTNRYDIYTNIRISKIRTLTSAEKRILFNTKSKKAVKNRHIVQLQIGSPVIYDGMEGVAFMYAELEDSKITHSKSVEGKTETTWLTKFKVQKIYGFENQTLKLIEINTASDVAAYTSFHVLHGYTPTCLITSEK